MALRLAHRAEPTPREERPTTSLGVEILKAAIVGNRARIEELDAARAAVDERAEPLDELGDAAEVESDLLIFGRLL